MPPQRPYVTHHHQNHSDQFVPESPITFPKTTGGDGIALMDAMNENFNSFIGQDRTSPLCLQVTRDQPSPSALR